MGCKLAFGSYDGEYKIKIIFGLKTLKHDLLTIIMHEYTIVYWVLTLKFVKLNQRSKYNQKP